MEDVADALEEAKEEIFITDWWWVSVGVLCACVCCRRFCRVWNVSAVSAVSSPVSYIHPVLTPQNWVQPQPQTWESKQTLRACVMKQVQLCLEIELPGFICLYYLSLCCWHVLIWSSDLKLRLAVQQTLPWWSTLLKGEWASWYQET